MEGSDKTKLSQRIVGYEKEVAVLQECVENLHASNTGTRLYLWGKAGMDKSLSVSMLENICENRRITCLSTASDNIMQESLLSVRKLFRRYFDCTSFESFVASYNKFIVQHAQKEPDAATLSEFQRMAVLFKHLIGEKESREEHGLIDSNDVLLTVELTLRSFIKSLALLNPLVLILEDLQWMDKDTKNFIELLNRVWSQLPILLIITGRPDRQLLSKTRNIRDNKNIQHIHLKPFSHKSTEALVSSILGGQAGKSVTDYVLSTSKGVQFFIEQYIQFLVVHKYLSKEKIILS